MRTRPPCLLFASDLDDAQAWRLSLAAVWPQLEVRIWPQLGNPDDVDVALVWKPPREALAACRNLKLVIILGAGGDAVIGEPALPPAVPLARLVDAGMTRMMVAYVVLAVLRYQREFERLHRERQAKRWTYLHPRDPANYRVGVIGLGALGSAVAKALAALGFDVEGWSRNQHAVDGVRCRAGTSTLHAFLARTDVVVMLLPLTEQTRRLLDRAALAALPRGARLINVGRGATIDEDALLEALDSGQLAEATLDVFEREPLPPDHRLWSMPQVMLTPHQASVADPRTAAPQVVENVRRALSGAPILHAIDRARGY